MTRKIGLRFIYLMDTKVITSIETQKKDHKRVNIYLNGEFGFGLSKMVAAWLKVDQELSDEKIKKLINDDQLEKATQSALHYISYRPRSISEVKKNLEEKEISNTVIDETINRLINNSILDDLLFAEQWVSNRNDLRPRSKFALSKELKDKGISEEIIEKVLENIDDEKLAYKAGKKYSHRLERANNFEFRKKLSSFLARRGFRYDIINPTIDQIWEEIQEKSIEGKFTINKEEL